MNQTIRRSLLMSVLVSSSLFISITSAPLAEAATDMITLTNKLENGKKVWQPATATVKAGDKVEITLVNTLADPHGFEIKEFGQKVVLGPKETKTISFDATKSGTFKFDCQLHPAHIGGELIVK